MKACNAKREQVWRDQIVHAWHVGALVRQRNSKKFPSLSEMLPANDQEKKAQRPEPQKPEEVLAIMQAWVVRTGG